VTGESLFQTPTPLLFQNFWIQIRVRQFFKIENPTPVQISDPIENYHWFYFINDHADSCYCRSWKMTPDPGPVFKKFFTPDPGPKKDAESCRSRLRHSESVATSGLLTVTGSTAWLRRLTETFWLTHRNARIRCWIYRTSKSSQLEKSEKLYSLKTISLIHPFSYLRFLLGGPRGETNFTRSLKIVS